LLGGKGIPALFVEAYGSVELSGAAMVRISPPFLHPTQGGFVGWPLPGYSVRIVDDAGVEVSPGVVGELLMKGPGVLRGYHGRDEATGATVQEGWLRTGDMASRGRTGAVSFAGRQKDVIKSGGYSVFPAEIETKLLEHPEVTKAAVVGVSHPTKGQVPVAVICLEPGSDVEPDHIREWIAAKVARYKAPRRVVVIDEADLPYGPTGKILKRVLADAIDDDRVIGA
jgi:acyl-CoA synthetase (AMP-forming)/AMP-acid ligase II